jgi:hypothetical protein
VFDKLGLKFEEARNQPELTDENGVASLTDVKQWAINSADEIKSELKAREALREAYRKAKQAVFNSSNNKQG